MRFLVWRADCTSNTLSMTDVGDRPMRRTLGGFAIPENDCDSSVTTAAVTARAAFLGNDEGL